MQHRKQCLLLSRVSRSCYNFRVFIW